MATGQQTTLLPIVTSPPSWCQYATGPCDQDFATTYASDALFLYPNVPSAIASSIEHAVEQGRVTGNRKWITWKDLPVGGQIIFCEICKAIRATRLVIADVTTLNFNLLFEIGFALGVGVPVLPIRDTSFKKDQKKFDELGVLDNFGYFDFQNSGELVKGVFERENSAPLSLQAPTLNPEQPIYLLKSPVETDGAVKLMSVIKKSGLHFKAFDPKETPRLSLHDAYRNTLSARAIILHLLAPEREQEVHNAKSAFVAGLAMASQKHVLMLQEGIATQPIDYRDIVRSYSRPSQIQELLLPLLREVIEELQPTRFVPSALPPKGLERIDLGDLAAENEIRGLGSYFVPTAEFQQAKRGNARLVVGRKGAGKTAVFYGIRSTYTRSRTHVVLDLKPEGHQFLKLKESVMSGLPEGVQLHVLTAFWNYLLVMELALYLIRYDSAMAYRDPRLTPLFEKIRDLYGVDEDTEQGDFSERLLLLVEQIAHRRQTMSEVSNTAEITQLIHSRDIRRLNDALSEYLSVSRREVWLLFDNIDKGWPIQAVRAEDIRLLRSLLEATRKLERQFQQRGIHLHALVFVRNDIYQHLILEPADRGKDSAVTLKWDDPELFKQVLGRRMAQSTNMELTFDELWAMFFASHVHGEASFNYILRRTLMRPREVLRFVRECINVAINRGHERVSEEDILQAEKAYSDAALVDITLEMKDVRPEYADIPYAFIGSSGTSSRRQLETIMSDVGISPSYSESAIDLLLWFGFLGIYVSDEEERYSYQFDYNIKLMRAGILAHGYSIHPAFHRALGVQGS